MDERNREERHKLWEAVHHDQKTRGRVQARVSFSERQEACQEAKELDGQFDSDQDPYEVIREHQDRIQQEWYDYQAGQAVRDQEQQWTEEVLQDLSNSDLLSVTMEAASDRNNVQDGGSAVEGHNNVGDGDRMEDARAARAEESQGNGRSGL